MSLSTIALAAILQLAGSRQMEKLDRGLVAVSEGGGKVYLSWRVWGTDPANISFNVYRDGTKINASPITGATNIVDVYVKYVRDKIDLPGEANLTHTVRGFGYELRAE